MPKTNPTNPFVIFISFHLGKKERKKKLPPPFNGLASLLSFIPKEKVDPDAPAGADVVVGLVDV